MTIVFNHLDIGDEFVIFLGEIARVHEVKQKTKRFIVSTLMLHCTCSIHRKGFNQASSRIHDKCFCCMENVLGNENDILSILK